MLTIIACFIGNVKIYTGFGIVITSLTGETGKSFNEFEFSHSLKASLVSGLTDKSLFLNQYSDNSDYTEAGEAFIGKTSGTRVLF